MSNNIVTAVVEKLAQLDAGPMSDWFVKSTGLARYHEVIFILEYINILIFFFIAYRWDQRADRKLKFISAQKVLWVQFGFIPFCFHISIYILHYKT